MKKIYSPVNDGSVLLSGGALVHGLVFDKSLLMTIYVVLFLCLAGSAGKGKSRR